MAAVYDTNQTWLANVTSNSDFEMHVLIYLKPATLQTRSNDVLKVKG